MKVHGRSHGKSHVFLHGCCRKSGHASLRHHCLAEAGVTEVAAAQIMRRMMKLTTSLQPAKAYEDESVMVSGPH